MGGRAAPGRGGPSPRGPPGPAPLATGAPGGAPPGGAGAAPRGGGGRRQGGAGARAARRAPQAKRSMRTDTTLPPMVVLFMLLTAISAASLLGKRTMPKPLQWMGGFRGDEEALRGDEETLRGNEEALRGDEKRQVAPAAADCMAGSSCTQGAAAAAAAARQQMQHQGIGVGIGKAKHRRRQRRRHREARGPRQAGAAAPTGTHRERPRLSNTTSARSISPQGVNASFSCCHVQSQGKLWTTTCGRVGWG